MPFVEIDRVSLRYGGEAKGVLALDGLDLAIEEGEPRACGNVARRRRLNRARPVGPAIVR